MFIENLGNDVSIGFTFFAYKVHDMIDLFTIGYQGRTPEPFLEALIEHGVEVLVDVRDRPQSRKRGFSKTPLKSLLEPAGIEYVHLRDLGVPVDIRKAYRAGELELSEYLTQYRHNLPHHADKVKELIDLVNDRRCCLLCFEHAPCECHRSVLADAVVNEAHYDLHVHNIL